MSLSPTPPQTLAQAALSLLDHARAESQKGYESDDRVYVMDAAEKAWNAVCHAIDHMMQRHGHPPAVGRDAHAARVAFLDSVGRHDLRVKYAYFADELHGLMFYEGRVPRRQTEMDRALSEVDQFVREATEG